MNTEHRYSLTTRYLRFCLIVSSIYSPCLLVWERWKAQHSMWMTETVYVHYFVNYSKLTGTIPKLIFFWKYECLLHDLNVKKIPFRVFYHHFSYFSICKSWILFFWRIWDINQNRPKWGRNKCNINLFDMNFYQIFLIFSEL